jgi:integrase
LRTKLLPSEAEAGFSIQLSLISQVNQLALKHTMAFEAATYSSKPESVVLDLELRERDVMLSDAIDVYLSNHRRGKEQVFAGYAKQKWGLLLGIVGDMPLRALARKHAKQFRDKRLLDGIKTTSVQREISVLSAVIRKSFFESDIDKLNPFGGIQINGLGEDSVARQPFSVDELRCLVANCLLIDDARRRILLLVSLTGMRLNEALGIRLSDLHLDGTESSYVEIKPHRSRRLKTKESERDIPLLPTVQDALKKQLSSLPEGEIFLFPQYASINGTLSNHASATLNKYIKSLGINKSTHCLRHSMRDLLREAGITKDVIDSIGGWSSGDIGSLYGRGYSLKVKFNALRVAYKPVFERAKCFIYDEASKRLLNNLGAGL